MIGFRTAVMGLAWLPLAWPAWGQIVKDGGFELGTPNPRWDEHSENFPSPICNVQRCGNFFGEAYEGDWWVWFGGAEQHETGWVRQEVTIPAGSATLAFWLDITASSGNGEDYFSASLDGEEVFKALESDADRFHPWRRVEIDISRFADDGAHLLSFDSTMTGPQRTNFFLDAVEIVTEGGGTCVYIVQSKAKGREGCPTETCPARGSEFDTHIDCGPPECRRKMKIKRLECPNGRDGYCKTVKLGQPRCEP